MEHDFVIISSNKKVGLSKRVIFARLAKELSSNLTSTLKTKLAQAMAAPIRDNIGYSGIAKRALTVQQLPSTTVYDSETESLSCVEEGYAHDDIVITRRKYIGQRSKMPFAGVRVTVPTFEVVSNPTVRISDVKRRRFNIIDRAVQTARAQIMAQEDDNIFAAIDAAAVSEIKYGK
jgi:hypothetical protein